MKKRTILLGVGLVAIIAMSLSVVYQKSQNNNLQVVEQTEPKMRKFIHNKLWRDKGPIRMEKTGSIVHVKDLTDEEYAHQLGLKLLEEAAEVHTAKTKEDLISEIGDVYEVLDCIIALHQLSREDIARDQDFKREERGSLLERKFVTMTESIPGTFLDLYCSKDPDKYQLILE